MKTSNIKTFLEQAGRLRYKRRTAGVPPASSVAVLLMALALSAPAAVFYQTGSMPNDGSHWNSAYWTNATQSTATVPTSGNTYVNSSAGNVRTPAVGGAFDGDLLSLNGAAQLLLKNGGDLATVDLVMEDGTSISQGGGGTAELGGTLTGAGTINLSTAGFASRTIQLDALLLPGNTISTINIVGSGAVDIRNSANTFSGVWNVQDGTLKGEGFGAGDFYVGADGVLDFDSSYFNPNALLFVENGGALLLDQHVTLYVAELEGAGGLLLGTHTGAELKAAYGDAIHPDSLDDATLTVTLAIITTLDDIEAEDMELSGYVVEDNAAASGGQLVRLTGDEGSAVAQAFGFQADYYDLTVGYFDETDGSASYKLYLNDVLIDSWLTDRRLGSSEPSSINYMERTVRRVYLTPGDRIEVFGQADGGEGGCIDAIRFADASPAVADNFMSWASDGSIASLVLNGVEHLDSSEDSGALQRYFNGWSISSSTMGMKEMRDSIVDLERPFTTWKKHIRCIFRMDAHDHHVALRLLDVVGIPQNDPSQSMRVEIPFLSSLGYQALDTNLAASVIGDALVVDWPHLGSRNLMAGGQIALYAVNDTAAAQAEIAQMYTDNGKLDPYYDWVDSFPIIGTDADLFADPDGDGLNNLTEYALGGVPNLGNDGVDSTHGIAGDDFEIQYNRRRDAAARGLSYEVVKTDDLVSANWSSNGVTESGSEILDAEFENVTNSVPTIGKTNEFLKLEIGIEK
ncbi:hypothetical protein P4B35_06185 [Pontiellaceae bacterium B12227]|nr:hypothetical protein [Pontiellaceae bacterium B12227]